MVLDAKQFRSEFEQYGPIVPGIEPIDASKRLQRFQGLFRDLERKWSTYADSEDLFGLPVTQYPELVKSKKELELLDRLYSLYLTVCKGVCACARTRARTRMHTHPCVHAHARARTGDIYDQSVWRHAVDGCGGQNGLDV